MVLSRKRRQKLRLEQQINNESPQTTAPQNDENVTGKKRKRGKKDSSELEGKVEENGETPGGVIKSFRVADVNGRDTEVNSNIINETKKRKKKKKKVKKKKIKVVEEKIIEVNEKIVEGNSNRNDGGAKEVYVGGISEQVVEDSSKGNDEGARKVYAGGMPYYYTEDDIRTYFNHCGAITEIDCVVFESGKFRGIAFITFETEEAAENALLLDGSDMDGRYLIMQPYKSNRPSKTSDFSPPIIQGYNRIYAGNLSYDITEDDVRKFFSDCNISTIRFGEDKDTHEFKGYAHVDFTDSESLNQALKLDQKFVCGRPMKISRAVPAKGPVRNGVSTPTAVKPENKIEVNPVVTPEINSGVNLAVTPNLAVTTKYNNVVKEYNSVVEEYNNVVEEVIPPPIENKSGVTSAKLKRRTCYDCGERGHISSDCPKKQSS